MASMTDVLEAGREEEQVEKAGSPNHHHAVPLSALPHLEALFSGSNPPTQGYRTVWLTHAPFFPLSFLPFFFLLLFPSSSQSSPIPHSFLPSIHHPSLLSFLPWFIPSLSLLSSHLILEELLSVGITDGCLKQLQISVSAFQ